MGIFDTATDFGSGIFPSVSGSGSSIGDLANITSNATTGGNGLSDFLNSNSGALGSALKLGGTLSAGLSGNPNSPAQSTSGFAALPAAAQNAWLQTYLPALLSQTSKAYQPPALQRATTTPGMFDSQGLADLQKYSDQVGGLFGKTNASPVAPNYGSTLAGVTNATGASPALTAADAQAQAIHGMSLASYVNNQRPDVAKALGYQPGQVNISDPNVLQWWNQYGSKGN